MHSEQSFDSIRYDSGWIRWWIAYCFLLNRLNSVDFSVNNNWHWKIHCKRKCILSICRRQMVIMLLFSSNIRNTFKPILITMKTGITIDVEQKWQWLFIGQALYTYFKFVIVDDVLWLCVVFTIFLYLFSVFFSLFVKFFFYFIWWRYFSECSKRFQTESHTALRCLRTMAAQHSKWK